MCSILQSWYPGSWSGLARSKAAPVTEVARESISVAQNVASTAAESSTSLIDTTRRARAPSIQLIKKAGASTRSLPVDATTTKINIASDGSASTTALEDTSTAEAAESTPELPKTESTSERTAALREESHKEQQTVDEGSLEANASSVGHAAPSEQPSGWLSWIYRSEPTEKSPKAEPATSETTERVSEVPQEQPPAGPQTATTLPEETAQTAQSPEQTTETAEVTPATNKRSWLQMFYGSSAATQEEKQTTETPDPTATEPSNETAESMAPRDPPEDRTEERALPNQGPDTNPRSSGWSFWSKDTSKDVASGKPQKAEAITATIPQDEPSRPTELEPNPNVHVNISKKGTLKVPQPKDAGAKDATVSMIEATSTNSSTAEERPLDTSASKQLQKILPNQVLPHFEDTYHLEESPSILQSLGRLLHYTKGPEHSHVARVGPTRIKRALAIGVHGYFPAPFIRTVLGQPTGTSIRFSNMAADAIHKWTENQGYQCEVEKIALEGEGRISERVDLLWKLLLNWMEEIRKADFILVASHSQGVPVSIMLVAKLIAFGCINASRVGICAMAGVNMGPFSSYRSRWISGSAGELFEFEQPSSKVSKDYDAALRCVLDYGVRISYIGSIDDQLVSLEVFQAPSVLRIQ